MSVKPEDITAALKKLGRAVSPGELADYLGIEKPALASALKPLLDAGTVVGTGVTNSRRVGLPGQKADDAPRPARKTKKRKSPKARRKTKRAPKEEPANFVPALTADGRLVILNGDDTLIFERDESSSIRELFQQYKD